jgi:hypothetical protein
MSPARRAKSRLRAAVVRAVLERDRHRCRAGLDGCEVRAVDAHELRSRAQKKDAELIVSNAVAVCRACHTHLHDNPAEANRLGLILRRGDVAGRGAA